jgi:hypothetical protein
MAKFPTDEDGQVLAGLAADGIDLTITRLIEFAVDAPNENAAQRIAAAIDQTGYVTEVYYDEGEPDENGNIDLIDPEFSPSWTVYTKVHMVPEYEKIVSIQSELDSLSAPFGGKSDGWGTMVEPE